MLDPWQCRPENVKSWETNRNPMLLFELSGLFLLRSVQRAFSTLLFHDPPRNTRSPVDLPPREGRMAPVTP